MVRFITQIIMFILMLVTWDSAASNSNESGEQTSNQLDDLILQANKKVSFNGVVLITKGEAVILEKAIGKVGKQSSVDLTTDYTFSPGSITKEFSVIALLQLQQQNKVNFDQSIAPYFPELAEWKNSITIEHLLTHSSGLPDVRYRKNMTTEQAIKDLKQLKHLKFAPGTRFDYGNNNTILRALVVERISGISFEEYLEKNVFVPAGMTDTFAKSDFNDVNRKIAQGAKPLALKGVTAYTTARDLQKLERYLWTDESLGKHFIETAITKTGKGGRGRAFYDFGFYETDAAGEVIAIEHDGTYPTHYTLKRTDLRNDYTIILLSNDGRKTTLNELRTAIVNYLENDQIEHPQTWSLIHDINLHGSTYAISKLKEKLNSGLISIDEDELNVIGYDFFYENDLVTASAVLKLNYERFPDSLNAIDSYAEILLESGKKQDAFPLVERGLQLAKEKQYDFYIQRFQQFLAQSH